MQTSTFYNLIAKITVLSGFDYENSPRLTDSEREAVRQGLRELQFYSPELIGLLQAKEVAEPQAVQAGARRKA